MDSQTPPGTSASLPPSIFLVFLQTPSLPVSSLSASLSLQPPLSDPGMPNPCRFPWHRVNIHSSSVPATPATPWAQGQSIFLQGLCSCSPLLFTMPEASSWLHQPQLLKEHPYKYLCPHRTGCSRALPIHTLLLCPPPIISITKANQGICNHCLFSHSGGKGGPEGCGSLSSLHSSVRTLLVCGHLRQQPQAMICATPLQRDVPRGLSREWKYSSASP